MKHTVSEVTLGNGAKGLFIHVPDATVMTFEFNFRAGEYMVATAKWETPHLMEHVVLGANELFPKAQLFYAEFEKNGAYSNASTSTYDITYEAECADFEWDRITGLLLTAITKPLFLEEEFEAEFGNVREEMSARSNNHFRHLSLALRAAYGFRVMTDQKRLMLMDNVRLPDIKEHYLRTHTSSNLRFVIAGKLPPDRQTTIRGLLENIELVRGSKRFTLPIEKPRPLANGPLYIPNETIENLYFYLDTFMPRCLSDSEADALSIVNILLTETFYSRILGAAREKGLIYHMSSGFGQTRNSSNWWFGAQVLPKNTKALFKIMIKELHNVFEGRITEEDIKAAQQYALGRYQRSAQTVGGTAAGYSGRYFFDGEVEDYYKIPQRIEDVNKEAIVEVSRQLFAKKIWGMGALGSTGQEFLKDLNDQLSVLWQ